MAADPGKRAAEILANTAKELKGAHSAALKDAGQEAKKVFLNELDKVTSGRRLRGVGAKGAKLSVGYEVTVSGNGGRMILKAKGPWQLIERGTKRHAIRPRKKSGKRALSFGGRAYAQVHHPGTKGKKPFDKGERDARPKVTKIVAARYMTAVSRAW